MDLFGPFFKLFGRPPFLGNAGPGGGGAGTLPGLPGLGGLLGSSGLLGKAAEQLLTPPGATNGAPQGLSAFASTLLGGSGGGASPQGLPALASALLGGSGGGGSSPDLAQLAAAFLGGQGGNAQGSNDQISQLFGGSGGSEAIKDQLQNLLNLNGIPQDVKEKVESMLKNGGSQSQVNDSPMTNIATPTTSQYQTSSTAIPNVESPSGGRNMFVENMLSLFDANRDGNLTQKEAKKAANQFDIGSRELKEVFKSLGVDKKEDTIPVNPMSDQIKLICVSKFKKAAFTHFFKFMDTDNSGTLNMQEVLDALKAFNISVPIAIATQIFDNLDANRDGEIDQNEFLSFLASVKENR